MSTAGSVPDAPFQAFQRGMAAVAASKVAGYEDFLNERLKVDLETVHDERDQLHERISEWCAPRTAKTGTTHPPASTTRLTSAASSSATT